MAVAFDSVGPSASGAGSTSSTTLSWTHTPSGTPTAILVGVAVTTSGSDASLVTAVTYGGTAMTSVGISHSGGSTSGYIQVFGLASPPSGAQTVAVTVTGGTPGALAGGSLAYTGTAGTFAAAFGTPVTANSGTTATTSGTVSVNGTSASNRVAGFACDGSGGESVTAGTLRYHDTNSSVGAAGSVFGADEASSAGGAQAVSWTQTSDWWGALAVEILAQPQITAGLATARGTAQPATTIPYTGYAGPNYPGAATGLTDGVGTWLNPFLAEGGPP